MDSMEQLDSNSVLITYLGAGVRGGYQPIGCEERLKSAYPTQFNQAKLLVEKYLNTMSDHPPNKWMSNDLAKERSIYESSLEAQYPELGKLAINSLACYWSYQWK